MTATDAGEVYPDFVKELLDAEDERRKSLEARGAGVITASGALVTLLLGLAAVVTKAQDFQLPSTARDLLSFAVIAFVVATILAIATYVPQPSRLPDASELAGDIQRTWSANADYARQRIVATRIEELDATQRANDRKALALLLAGIAQVLAVLLVAVAVLDIL